MATVKSSYRASADLTFTSLQSLAQSTTWVAGAESGAYDNSTNLDLDAFLSGKFALNTSATPAAGTQIIVWVVPEIADGVWPDVMDGTDSAETWTNIQMRDSSAKIAATIDVGSATNSLVQPFHCGSIATLFGFMPKKFVVFVAHNLGASCALAATGSVVSVTGYSRTIT